MTRIEPAKRYRVSNADGAVVTTDCAAASAAVCTLPEGAIVLSAQVGVDADRAERVRISSPAGWLNAAYLEPAAPPPSIRLDFETFKENHLKIAPGDRYALDFPFTVDQLREFGAKFLTTAFRAAGTISPDNEVTQIVAIEPMKTMGASESAFLTLAYARDEPGVDTQLFVKFPPDKGVEYKHFLTSMSHGEVEMQRLVGSIDLPFETAKYYFGDYSSTTSNYILITERIKYATPPIEPPHRKGYDHNVPAVTEHYIVMARALAGLVAAHKSGALGLDIETTFPFARAARDFDRIPSPEASVDRLVDFVGRIAPQLFVAGASDPAFLKQWREDLLFGLEHKDAVVAFLHADVDYTGLCHPNLNLDNGWFWRDANERLHVGLIDWGGAGQMSIAQAISGMLMMPIPEDYLDLQQQVIATFVEDLKRRGGPVLDPATLLFHYKASVFSTAICTIIAVIVDMLGNFTEDEYRSMESRWDARLIDGGFYSAIVWIDNMLRDWQDVVTPGQACRQIVDRQPDHAKVDVAAQA